MIDSTWRPVVRRSTHHAPGEPIVIDSWAANRIEFDHPQQKEEIIMDEKTKQYYVAQRNAILTQANLIVAKIKNSGSLLEIAKNWEELSKFLYQIKEYQKMIGPTSAFDDIILAMTKSVEIKATNLAVETADVTIEKLKTISKEKKRNHLLNDAKMQISNAELLGRNLTGDRELLGKLEEKMSELMSIG
jgi:hypothetical protein